MRRMGAVPVSALVCALVIVLCCTTVKNAGAALSFPSATISIGFDYEPTITTPGTYTVVNQDGTSTASAYWSEGVGSAAASGSGIGGEFTPADQEINTAASAICYLEVNGPTILGGVPLIITAAGGVSASGTAGATAGVLMGEYGEPWTVFSVAAQTGIGASSQVPSAAFSGSKKEYVTPGQTYYINTEAYISLGYFLGSASAWVDPTVVIDPTFADASDYTLTVSSDLTPGPSAATPAPCTMLLLGPGLVGLAAIRRRLKK